MLLASLDTFWLFFGNCGLGNDKIDNSDHGRIASELNLVCCPFTAALSFWFLLSSWLFWF